EREHEVIAVEDEEFTSLLDGARKMIDEQPQQENASLNRARWIVAALSQMPVPLVWYEQAARNQGRSTLTRLVDLLCARHEAGMGPALQSLKMQFQAILNYLQDRNPRAKKWAAILPALVQDAGRAMILVRDRISKTALQNWLDVEAHPKAKW